MLVHQRVLPSPCCLGSLGSFESGPSLPLDYFTDYSGGAMFALARAKDAEPGPPQLGALMKLRRFDRCALNAIVAYRSYAGHGGMVLKGEKMREKYGKTIELVIFL